MSQVPMKQINLVNKEILATLDSYVECCNRWTEKGLFAIKNNQIVGHSDGTMEDWTSDKFMHHIIDQGESHAGFPDCCFEWKLSLPNNKDSKTVYTEQELAFRNESRAIVMDFVAQVGAQRNALTAHYPPGGFISWHNNANAFGYNLILTWSETGDGWFDYYDLEKKERVRMHDVPGWQAKMGYFGGYHEPEKLFYHAAATNCKRYTLGFVFQDEEDWWKYAIEDMETP